MDFIDSYASKYDYFAIVISACNVHNRFWHNLLAHKGGCGSSLFSTDYNPGMSAFHFTFCTQPQTASHLDAVWLRTDLVSSNDSPTTLFYDQLTFRRINACLSTGKNYTFGGINISECLRHIPKFFSSIFNIIWKTYSSELLYLDPTYDMFPGEYIDASGVGGHLVSWDKYEGYCGRQREN